jgi:chaperone modulatory protein CbpM
MYAKLEAEVLEAWVEAGWLKPARRGGLRHFSEVDLARTQFIRDLKEGLGVNDEGISAILDLVDQLHGLRRMLHRLLSALSMQPEMQRQNIVRQVRAAMTKGAPSKGVTAKHSTAGRRQPSAGKIDALKGAPERMIRPSSMVRRAKE